MFSFLIKIVESFAEPIVLSLLFAESIRFWRDSIFFETHVSISTLFNSFVNAFLIMKDILSCTIELWLIQRAPKLWNLLVNQVASYLNWFRWKCWSDTEATWGMLRRVPFWLSLFIIGTTRFTFVSKWQFSGINSSTSSSSTS